jgi:transposase
MSRPVRIAWTETADEMYAHFTGERDGRRRQRLQALWLVRCGRPIAEAAQIAGVGQRSLERWLGWYRHGGLAQVLARVPGHGACGQPSRLTREQQQLLVAETATGAFRTYAEARVWVEEAFGVRYTDKGMYTLLARFGVHPKVPRPQAEKADPVAQATWKRGALPTPLARRASPPAPRC